MINITTYILYPIKLRPKNVENILRNKFRNISRYMLYFIALYVTMILNKIIVTSFHVKMKVILKKI